MKAAQDLNQQENTRIPPCGGMWNDVPHGTMDEVSSYVRLNLPFV